jgi:hypothetical protein
MALKDNEYAAFLLVNTMDTILSIASEVYAVVALANKDNKKFNQDMFSLCTMAVDNGIINVVSTILSIIGTTKSSALSLGSDGSVTISAQSFINATTTQATKVSSPTLAFQQVALVAKTIALLPKASNILRTATTSIKSFVENAQKEKTIEEL